MPPEMPAQGIQTSLVETMSNLLQASNGRIAGLQVVKVRGFNGVARTVTAEPMVKRGSRTQSEVNDVPVLFPGTKWDIQDGEYGALICGGLNWRRWWRTGEVSVAEDGAQHDLSTGILIAGLLPQTTPDNIPSGTIIIQKPTVSGSVLLGSSAAVRAIMHETFLSGFDAFLAALDTWGAAVGTATGVPWAPVTATIAILRAGIAANGYVSSSAFVED